MNLSDTLLTVTLGGAALGGIGVWASAVCDVARIARAHWHLRQIAEAVRYAALVLVYVFLPATGIAIALRLFGV